MIDLLKIHQLSIKKYEQLLKSIIAEENIFPLEIPFSQIKPFETQIKYNSINETISELERESKQQKGFGYSIEFTIIDDRKIGKRKNPEKIYFETIDDYIKFIRKKEELNRFRNDYQQIIIDVPELKKWLLENPLEIINYNSIWKELVKVCKYFIHNPKPNLYLRELPIEIDTKFIEKNKKILNSILSFLLDEQADFTKSKFEDKFHLKSDYEMLRFRSLDFELCSIGDKKIQEMLLSYKDFSEIELNIDIDIVFIVENKITYLSFPKFKNAICIWGKGFFVEELKNSSWLATKEIIYFGDMDVSGFLILSRTRSIFPTTKSMLMNKDIFLRYENYSVTDKYEKIITSPENLTGEEKELFEIINHRNINNRLEQERIPQSEIEKYLTYSKKLQTNLDQSNL